MTHMAIIGGGIIGSSWALVFARAGLQVKVFARHDTVRASLHERIGVMAERAQAIRPDVPVAEILKRISLVDEIGAAVTGAGFVQESLEEKIEVKREVFAVLDRLTPEDAIIGSSTSSFGVSSFVDGVKGRHRCIVAHPAAVPHLIPVVEVVPAVFTALETVETTFELMKAMGQSPVLVRREQPGFVMNRLQGALLTEMFRVIEDGLMSPEDVDKLISDGFGLRWAFLGPLEGIDLNAPGGIADYLKRYGFMFDDLARQRGAKGPVVTKSVIATLNDAMRGELPIEQLEDKRAWRDQRMARLRALRDEMGPFLGTEPV